MALLNTCRRTRGFTLMEIIVVLALMSLLLGLGLVLSIDVFRGQTFRSTRSVLVSALTTARSRALANLGQSSYGVCYDQTSHDFFIFKGSTYTAGAAANDRVPGNNGVTLTSASNFFNCCSSGSCTTGVVFSQTAATTTNTGNITVSEPGHPDAIVNVNNEGTIVW